MGIIEQSPISPIEFYVWRAAGRRPNAAWNMPKAFRLRGKVDTSALEAAFHQVTVRHDVLRTIWPAEGDSPQPRVIESDCCQLSVTDARDWKDPLGRVMNAFGDEESQPIDLQKVYPWRAQLFQLGEADFVVLVTTHLMAFDMSSWSTFWSEIGASYAAAVAGTLSPDPPKTHVAGRELARIEHERSTSSAGRAATQYYLGCLADRPAVPWQRARPSDGWTWRGSEVPVRIPAPVAAGVEKRRRDLRTTLQALLLAVWGRVLHDALGVERMLVAAPVTRRTIPSLEFGIGPLVGTTLLELNVHDGAGLADLVQRATSAVRNTWHHLEAPAEAAFLSEAEWTERPPVPFGLNVSAGGHSTGPELPGVSVQRLHTDTRTSRYELALSINTTSDGLWGRLEFGEHVLNREDATRIAELFEKTLKEELQ